MSQINNEYSIQLNSPVYKTKKNISYQLIEFAFYFLTISELLPFISSFNARIIYSIKLLMIVFFFLGILTIRRKWFFEYFLIFILQIGFNIYMHYQVFYRYDISIMFVLTRSSMCWLYMLMGLYLSRLNDNTLKRHLKTISQLLICLTSVTTMIGLQMYPEASRSIGNGVKLQEIDTLSLYRMNVAPWGLIFAMAIALSFWLFEYRQTKKKVYLFVSLISTLCILKSQLTFAILFAFIIWGAILLFYKRSTVKVFVVVYLVIVCGSIFYICRAEIMLFLSNFFASIGSKTLQRRFYQLYISFLYGEWYGDSRARFDLYFMSLETFFKNPLLGYHVQEYDREFTQIGMHSTLFDSLGSTGIAGTMCIIPSFIRIVRRIKVSVSNEYRLVFFLSIGTLLLLNIINPTYKCPQVYFAAFIIPQLYIGKKN